MVLCFIGPLLYSPDPPYMYVLLGIASCLAIGAFGWSWGKDPFLRERFPEMLVWILCLKAMGFSFLSTPGLPSIDGPTLACLLIYPILIYLVPFKSANKLQKLEAEYYAYSQPSKKILVDIVVRRGQIDEKQANEKREKYLSEGLSYKRFTRVANLLIHEAFGVYILFVLFGFKYPYMLMLSLAGSLAISFALKRSISQTGN